MKFQEAFELILGLHEQCGDSSGWLICREEARNSTQNFASYENWLTRLPLRTDISDDLRWDLECFNESFKLLFALTQTQPPCPACEKLKAALEKIVSHHEGILNKRGKEKDPIEKHVLQLYGEATLYDSMISEKALAEHKKEREL